MSCRTGPLRVARAFARLFKLCGQNPKRWPSRWSGLSFSDQREDHNRSHQRDKVYTPRSGRPTRSGPVRQDISFQQERLLGTS
jgi:hypothetical protein